jgi:hypothetical protein
MDFETIAARLYVGITGKSTENCEWYEGILGDAIAEYEEAIADAAR